MRIAFAGIVHESLIFSPLRSRARDFRVLRGRELMDSLDVASTLEELRIEAIPILLASHLAPSGIVEEGAYLGWRDEIVRGLESAGTLDGVCLVLHGAMTVEHIWNGETDLLREVRAALGDAVPIAARLDPHANVTEEFANKVDTWAVFRTAPHRDTRETLARTLRLLARRIANGRRSRPAFVRVPMLLPGERATTGVEPMASLLATAREIEAMPGILNAEVIIGFGWADSPYSTASVAVVAEDDAHLPLARREARRLAQAMWDRRHDFAFDQEVAPSIDVAIDRALEAAEPCVFLADSGDNITAGAPGDRMDILSRLLARGVPDAVVAGLPAAEGVAACAAAGLGAAVSIPLGGGRTLAGTVEHVAGTSPDQPWLATALVRSGGVRVILTSIRHAFTTLEQFRRAGVEPLGHKIVVVKLGYLFPELRDAGPREILVLSPGASDMDLRRLPFRYVTRPILPLDDDFGWHPAVSGVAAYGEDREHPSP